MGGQLKTQLKKMLDICSKEEIKKTYEKINYYDMDSWKKIPLLVILAEVLVTI